MEGAGEPLTSGLCGPPNGLYIFSSTGSSLPNSSSSSLSDGKLSSTEKCLAVTLMFSYSAGKKVLFLEAGKDFVDILISLLTLPLGRVIKLLHSDDDMTKLDGGIFKVFTSVEKMDEDKFRTSKKSLLEPLPSSHSVSKFLQLDSDQENAPSSCSGAGVYYSCGMVPHCVYITKKLGWRCPRHGRKMQTLCRFADGIRESTKVTPPAVDKGFVKEGSKYIITDNLQIYPSSESLMLLQKLNIDTMSILNNVDMLVGLEEILKLLKSSLTSTTVLQDVFGKVLQDRNMVPDDEELCRAAKATPRSGEGSPSDRRDLCNTSHNSNLVRPRSRPPYNPSPSLLRPQSVPYMSRNAGRNVTYESLAADQKCLNSSSPYVTKKISSYSKLPRRNVARKHVDFNFDQGVSESLTV